MNNLFSLVFQIVLLLLSLLENLLCQVKRRTSKKMNNKKAKNQPVCSTKIGFLYKNNVLIRHGV